ncbi:hypothetical protein ACFX2I_008615 [Malus domestica]
MSPSPRAPGFPQLLCGGKPITPTSSSCSNGHSSKNKLTSIKKFVACRTISLASSTRAALPSTLEPFVPKIMSTITLFQRFGNSSVRFTASQLSASQLSAFLNAAHSRFLLQSFGNSSMRRSRDSYCRGLFSYLRVELGDFVAFTAAGNILLEYVIGNVAVARSWTFYFTTLCNYSDTNDFRIVAHDLPKDYRLQSCLWIIRSPTRSPSPSSALWFDFRRHWRS